MIVGAISAAPVRAQTVFICEGEARSFAVAGAAGAPEGCRELADPEAELLLSPPQPDLATLARDVSRLSQRVARLEALLVRPRPRTGPLAPAARPDPFDTRGRTRDLGQDIERRLEDLGR